MRKYVLWLSLLLVSLVSMPTSFAETIDSTNLNEVTIELTHENHNPEGTAFSVYGISAEDYNYALSMKYETSISKAKNWIKEKGILKTKEVIVSSSNKVNFSLSRYNDQKEKMYYVILQNKPDREGVNGTELYESFPSFISLDEIENDFLAVQTKRVFMFYTPYLFKYSSGANQKPLKGAEFALYQLISSHEKEYLVQTEPIEFKSITKIDEAWKFISDETGLVVLPNLELPVGTYYFEETKAPQGYVITADARNIRLDIEEDPENGLIFKINGEVLQAVQAGELPTEVISKGTPRILNDLSKEPPVKEDPPTKVTTENESPKKYEFLPKTGEEMMMFSSFGFILMLAAYKLMKRGKENE